MTGLVLLWTPFALLGAIAACLVAAITGGGDLAWMLTIGGSLLGGLAGGVTGLVLACLRHWRLAAAWLALPAVLVLAVMHPRQVRMGVQAVACASGLAGPVAAAACHR